MRKQFTLFLPLICLTILIVVPFVHGQETPTVLKPNQLMTFSLAPAQEKVFVLQMKKGDFAEIESLAGEGLNLSFEVYDSARKELLEKFGEIEGIWFVAPRDGDFILICKLGKFDGSEISGAQRVSIQYNNKFKLPSGTKLKATRKVNGFDIKIMATPESSRDEGSILLIEKNGRLQKAMKREDYSGFSFVDETDSIYFAKEIQLIRNTPDKTGNGIPDIMVDYFSGGAHCCFETYFFDLGDTVKLSESIGRLHTEKMGIRKNPKGGLLFVIHDWSFAYWSTSFAQSPAPTVILEFRNGKLRPNFDLMKKPAQLLAVLKKKAQVQRQQLSLEPYRGEKNEGCRRPSFLSLDASGRLHQEYDFSPCLYKDDGFAPVFWGVILDLIYTGHEDLAWQYLDLVWSPQKQGKAIFIRDFKKHLMESQYWQMILEDKNMQG